MGSWGLGKVTSALGSEEFRKGLVDRGGWREETIPVPEIQTSFLHSFSCPLAEKVYSGLC